MFKILRIVCCVICALLLAACVFVFIYLGTVWGIADVIAAAAFFALTMLFKSLQEDYEKKHPEKFSATTEENAVPLPSDAEESQSPDNLVETQNAINKEE